jgi:hypothetical protein
MTAAIIEYDFKTRVLSTFFKKSFNEEGFHFSQITTTEKGTKSSTIPTHARQPHTIERQRTLHAGADTYFISCLTSTIGYSFLK